MQTRLSTSDQLALASLSAVLMPVLHFLKSRIVGKAHAIICVACVIAGNGEHERESKQLYVAEASTRKSCLWHQSVV
eukprot:6202185-Pleurochrysis_carterae.AAC.1